MGDIFTPKRANRWLTAGAVLVALAFAWANAPAWAEENAAPPPSISFMTEHMPRGFVQGLAENGLGLVSLERLDNLGVTIIEIQVRPEDTPEDIAARLTLAFPGHDFSPLDDKTDADMNMVSTNVR